MRSGFIYEIENNWTRKLTKNKVSANISDVLSTCIPQFIIKLFIFIKGICASKTLSTGSFHNNKPDNNAPKKDDNNVNVNITILEAGEMSLHIGANAYQTMNVTIPKVTPKTLGVDIVNIRTIQGAERAIDVVNEAIIELSTIRAKLGAYENRLEHAIANLDTSNENMTESLSRIEDTDMAAEMTTYTKTNILQQAAQSMLAQANQSTQGVLSLIQ